MVNVCGLTCVQVALSLPPAPGGAFEGQTPRAGTAKIRLWGPLQVPGASCPQRVLAPVAGTPGPALSTLCLAGPQQLARRGQETQMEGGTDSISPGAEGTLEAVLGRPLTPSSCGPAWGLLV